MNKAFGPFVGMLTMTDGSGLYLSGANCAMNAGDCFRCKSSTPSPACSTARCLGANLAGWASAFSPADITRAAVKMIVFISKCFDSCVYHTHLGPNLSGIRNGADASAIPTQVYSGRAARHLVFVINSWRQRPRL